MSLVVLHFSVFKQKYGSSTVYWEFEQNCEILNKITKNYEKHTKCVIFRKLPLDRKNSFLPKTDFIEIVCFLYWCFEKTKLEIQFYTVLSDLQNQVIEIPIKIKRKNMYLFFRARVVNMITW